MPSSLIRTIAMILACAASATGAPLRILAIGDSMTEEYAFELTFSAPVSNPTNANTRSWPELLRIFRSGEASLGPYKATALSYLDLRNAGHEWNFGIPGTTTVNWKNLLAGTPGSDPLGMFYGITKNALSSEMQLAQAVVILLGANDLKQDYNDIFNDTEPAGYFTDLLGRLNYVHAWVRATRPNVPIVVCTLPDVGATPQISGIYDVPAKQASTRSKIAAFNRSIVTWATTKNPRPSIARIDLLTDRIFDEQPFHLNGTVFQAGGTPENHPTSIFCRDNFHAATMAQALIANEIMNALHASTGAGLNPFSNREILRNLLGLDPDQPYLAWIAAAGLEGSAMDDDPDGDSLPNLVEYLLASDPGAVGMPVAGSYSPGREVSWRPDPVALRFASLVAEESTDLLTWSPVPPERIRVAPDGTTAVSPAGGHRAFVRLKASVRP